MSNDNPKGLFKSSNFDWLYAGMDDKCLRRAKKHFMNSVKQMWDWEKKECEKLGQESCFTLDNQNTVQKIVDSCSDFYELEALNKCLFSYNIIPTGYEQIKKAGSILREK